MDYFLNSLIEVSLFLFIIIYLKTHLVQYVFTINGSYFPSEQVVNELHYHEIEFIKITLENTSSLEVLKNFYEQVFKKSFIDENQMESYENLLIYLKNGEKATRYDYQIIIAKRHHTILGGIIGDYYYDINSGFIEYIAINPEFRGQNLGAKLINEFERLLNLKSQSIGFYGVNYIYVEVENPRLVNEDEIILYNPYNRLHFWDKNGFKAVDTTYLQPKLGNDKQSLPYLILGIKVLNQELNLNTIETKHVKRFFCDYAMYSTLIKNPLNDPDILNDCNFLKGHTQKILSFNEYISK